MNIPEDPISWWVKNVLPRLQATRSFVPAKSKKFRDVRTGEIREANLVDQSMYSHVYTAVFAVHTLIHNVGIRLTPEEERLAYAMLSIHDLHKENAAGHHATLDEYVSLSREIGYDDETLPRQSIDDFLKKPVDIHHQKESAEEDVNARPEYDYNRDIFYHLLIIGDAIASKPSMKSLMHVGNDGLPMIVRMLDKMNGFTRRCTTPVGKVNFIYFITDRHDGELTGTVQRFANARMIEKGYKFLFSCTDGSLFYIGGNPPLVDGIKDAIASDIFSMIGNQIVVVSWKSTHNTIASGVENAECMTAGELMDVMHAQIKDRYIKNNTYSLKILSIHEKLFSIEKGAIVKTVSDLYGSVDAFVSLFNSKTSPFTLDDYATYIYLDMMSTVIPLYSNRVKVDPKSLINLLGIDTSIEGEIDEKCKFKPNNQLNFPIVIIAKHLREKIDPSSSPSTFCGNILRYIKDRVDITNDTLLATKKTDRSIIDEIKAIVKNNISFGIDSTPTIVDFGLKAYTIGLKTPSSLSFTTKCLLCHEPETVDTKLKIVNSNLLGFSVQCQKDRLPSRGMTGSLSDKKMFKVCPSCYLSLLLKKMREPKFNPKNMSKKWYITIYPDYLFTPSMDAWFKPMLNAMFSIMKIEKKDVDKAVTSEDRINVISEIVSNGGVNLSEYMTGMVSSIINISFPAKKPGHECTLIDKMIPALKKYAITSILSNLKIKWKKDGWEDFGDDDGIKLVNDAKQGWLKDRFAGQNYYSIPVNLDFGKNDKNHDRTSAFSTVTLMASMISLFTGCRVTITQEYNNIKMIEPRSMITFDTMPSTLKDVIRGDDVQISTEVPNNIRVVFEKLLLMMHVAMECYGKKKAITGIEKVLVETPTRAIRYLHRILKDKQKKMTINSMTKVVLALSDICASTDA
jgi:hypothetical protein